MIPMAFMDDLADLFTQTVIWRALTGRDDFGKPTYGAGTSLSARVVRKNKLIRDTNGDEVVSSAQAHINGNSDIAPDDQVELPDGDTPHILSVERFPDETGYIYTRVFFR